MFIGLALASAMVLSSLPPKVNTEKGRAVWQQYSRVQLTKLFPEEYADASSDYPLLIFDSQEVDAGRIGAILEFNFGLLAVMKNEAQYASVLAHEVGHIMLGHESTQLFDWFRPAGDDMVLLEQQETEADQFALLVLRRAGYQPCATAEALTQSLNANGMRAHPGGLHATVHLRREAALIAGCNLLAMPSADKDTFKRAFWRVYIDLALRTLWPKDSPFTTVEVTAQDDFIVKHDSQTKTLRFGPEFLRLVRKPDDIVFATAHEATHLLLHHRRQEVTVDGKMVPDFASMENQEVVADIRAVALMRIRGLDTCAPLRLARRLAQHFKAADDPDDPYNSISLMRIRVLEKLCRPR